MIPFDVISKRSRKIRTVYAVRHTTGGGAEFLVYRFGGWCWENAKWYEPVVQEARE